MRSRLALVNMSQTIVSRVSGLSDQVYLASDSTTQRVAPILADQHVHHRFILKKSGDEGDTISIDLASLELTTAINIIASGPFQFSPRLATQNKNQDKQTVSGDGIENWAIDQDGTPVKPWFYCAKQFSFFQGTNLNNNGVVQLDPTVPPNVYSQSAIAIDFNKLCTDWETPPKNGTIRISAVLSDRGTPRFDLELYGRDYEDTGSRVFQIHEQNEDDEEGAPAQRTALSFINAFISNQVAGISLTDIEETPIFDYVQPTKGVVVIWTRVTRPQQDMQKYHDPLSRQGSLTITIGTQPTAGHYFDLDTPAMKMRKKLSSVPVRFTAVASNPNLLNGEYLIGASTTLTAANLAATINFLATRGNSPYDVCHYMFESATSNTNVVTVTPFYKGDFGLFEVDRGAKKYEIALPNNNLITPDPLANDDEYLVAMSLNSMPFPIRRGDRLTLSVCDDEPAYNGTWDVASIAKISGVPCAFFYVDRSVAAPTIELDTADDDEPVLSIIEAWRRHNYNFVGSVATTLTFNQTHGYDWEARFEGDIIVGVTDNGTGEGWTHVKYQYSGGIAGWNGLSAPAREAIEADPFSPRWGITDPQDGSLPFCDRGRLGLAKNDDPVRAYYFKEQPANVIQHSESKKYYITYPEDPYPGRSIAAVGISVRPGMGKDFRYGPLGGDTLVGGPATALVMAPYGGDTIYKTADALTGVDNKFAYVNVFQFVNYFCVPSTYFPPWSYVPIGADNSENISNLSAAVASVYSRFAIKTVSINQWKFCAISFCCNDSGVMFDETRFTLDYNLPNYFGLTTTTSGYEPVRRHIIAVDVKNPNDVDITVEFLALGNRLHGRGSFHNEIGI